MNNDRQHFNTGAGGYFLFMCYLALLTVTDLVGDN